ncbi:hypothetical protein PSY31_23870, partial [Shigella flexneri]|nr:hypothetical protein [Shigella flexneri]
QNAGIEVEFERGEQHFPFQEEEESSESPEADTTQPDQNEMVQDEAENLSNYHLARDRERRNIVRPARYANYADLIYFAF